MRTIIHHEPGSDAEFAEWLSFGGVDMTLQEFREYEAECRRTGYWPESGGQPDLTDSRWYTRTERAKQGVIPLLPGTV